MALIGMLDKSRLVSDMRELANSLDAWDGDDLTIGSISDAAEMSKAFAKGLDSLKMNVSVVNLLFMVAAKMSEPGNPAT